MNTKQKVGTPIAILIVAVAIAVFGGAGYFLFGRSVEAAPVQVQAQGELTDQQVNDAQQMKANGKEAAVSQD